MILKGSKKYYLFQKNLCKLSSGNLLNVFPDDLLLPEAKDCVEFVHEIVVNKVLLQIILPTLLLIGISKMATSYYSS
jgi:hypothetical protein